ncbi:MAG: hypothetical protein JST73_07625 [Actinobacteria bacterium]|nr:hypothetical protein [Actinomycetota bacterium]
MRVHNPESTIMVDLGFLAIIVAFFVVATAYVRGCDRIIGGDEVTSDPVADATAAQQR